MDPLIIGRDPGCDIVVSDNSVSRRHAEVVDLGDGRFQLRDLASTNGTYYDLNGRFARVEDSVLVDGATAVSIGDYETTIAELAEAASRLPPAPAQAAEPRPVPPAPPPRPDPAADVNFSEGTGPMEPPARIPGAGSFPGFGSGAGPNWILIGGIAGAAVLLIAIAAVVLWPSPRDIFVRGCIGEETRNTASAKRRRNAEETCKCAGDILEGRLTDGDYKALNAELSRVRGRPDLGDEIGKRIVSGTLVNQRVSVTLLQAAKVCAKK